MARTSLVARKPGRGLESRCRNGGSGEKSPLPTGEGGVRGYGVGRRSALALFDTVSPHPSGACPTPVSGSYTIRFHPSGEGCWCCTPPHRGHLSGMTRTLKIDFVSDVVCPWCVVGLGGLETALGRLAAEGITAEIAFRPFELNPGMAAEGENVGEHIARKYGSTPEQSAANRAMITERAAEAWEGFEMRMGPDSRIWNTFDAHRLLH